jgi:hypothetical protein
MSIGYFLLYGYFYFFVVYYIVFFITLIYYIIVEEWFCKNRIPEWYEKAHRYISLQQEEETEETEETCEEKNNDTINENIQLREVDTHENIRQ